MMAFWISAGVLTLASLGFVLFPLVRRSTPKPVEDTLGVYVYREQLDEVERDAKNGVLSSQEAAMAKNEIERRLLSVIDSGEKKSSKIDRIFSWSAITGIVLIVPVGGLLLYAYLGAPNFPDNPLAKRTAELEWAAQKKQIADVVERLAARLKENPDNSKGWSMLGRSYQILDRRDESIKAYSRAYTLDPDNIDIAINYGQSIVYGDQGRVSKTALAVFEAVLKRDPANLKGRYFLGVSKAQTETGMAEAIKIWTAIEKESPPDAPWLPGLQKQIEFAKRSIGAKKNIKESGGDAKSQSGPLSDG